MNKSTSWFCKILIAPFVRGLFIKKINGSENIPKGNFILASNHQSHLDILICGYLCVPRKFTYIGQVDKYEGFQAFLRNIFYAFGGVIPVNRKDEVSKKEATLKAINALKKGYSLVIYPEGTRSRTGEIQEGKLGIAKIFLKTKVPVLPLGIKGTFELMAPGKETPRFKKIVEANVGKPLFFEEELKSAAGLNENSEEYKNVLQKITDKIMEEVQKLAV